MVDSSSNPDFFPLYHHQYRVILIGDSTVGKSSLLRYFTENRSAGISDPTVGVDFYARLIEVKPDYRVKLQLWDTAGQEKFKWVYFSCRNCRIRGQSRAPTTGTRPA